MGKKRYRSIYDALDDVLMGSMDTRGVKDAKARMEEKRKQQQEQQQAQAKKYVTMDEALNPYADKIRKLEAMAKDPAASPSEKESALRAIERLKEKAKGGK